MALLVALSAKQTRMLDILSRRAAWVTAAELAQDLGVTSRSIRSYAAALGELVESGPNGYRVKGDAYAAYLADVPEASPSAGSPQERLAFLARRLLDEPEGIDVYETAESLFVSDSTIESDLTRVRSLLADTELELDRHGPVARLNGPEIARRKLISRLFRDETRQGVVDVSRIQEAFASEGLAAFKSDLVEMLDARGFFVNEYGINDVLLHMAVALDRVAKNRVLPAAGAAEAGRRCAAWRTTWAGSCARTSTWSSTRPSCATSPSCCGRGSSRRERGRTASPSSSATTTSPPCAGSCRAPPRSTWSTSATRTSSCGSPSTYRIWWRGRTRTRTPATRSPGRSRARTR
ncbi:BglG family transcription antiterminator [Leifsonia sp. L25]|uniref:BglG family transcription antiterminator n=1 Tax=Leifsonia sp. L25 TaxID=3423957 RepID=UPI003D69A4BE